MRVEIFPDAETAGNRVADLIEARIRAGRAVLGLPTGSTPLPVYRRLVERVRSGRLSMRDVETFNMDEYEGLAREHEQSYWHFMHTNLFDHVDVGAVHMLDGQAADPSHECRAYEDAIRAAGGIDLFLCGVGQDGHIAFNEPGVSLSSRTHRQPLTRDTIRANSRFFNFDEALVPRHALTVGVATVMDARQVIIMATGPSKALAVRQIVEGAVSTMWPATIIQHHPDAILICDEESVSELKVKTYRFWKDA